MVPMAPDSDERGQQNVVGALLVVALVLLLIVLLWQFVGGFAPILGLGAPNAQFTFEVQDDDLRVTHESGATIDGADLLIVESGETELFRRWAGTACAEPVERVATGAQCLVEGAATAQSVTVVWDDPDSNRQFVLARWSPPTETGAGATPTPSGGGSGGSGGATTPTATPAGGGGGGDGGTGGTGGAGGGADPDVVTDEGWGDGEFDEFVAWEAVGRVGTDGSGDLRVTDDDGQTQQAHAWESNRTEQFQLTYDGSTANLTVNGTTVTRSIAASPDGSIAVTARALDLDDDEQPDGSVRLANLTLDGQPFGPGEVEATDGMRYVYVRDAGVDDGFVLNGTVTVTWDDDVTPAGNELAFYVHIER
jgi:hypothetical protein